MEVTTIMLACGFGPLTLRRAYGATLPLASAFRELAAGLRRRRR